MWSRLFANRAFTHIGLLVLAGIAAIIYIKVFLPAPPLQSGQGPVTVAPKPRKARVVERIVQGPERIVYIDKPALAASLKMPEIALMNDNVIAVAEVAPSRGKTTAIATIGPGSDNVWRGGILLRREPVPFWGLEREWHGGLWYGVAGRSKIQAEVEFLPLRIGPVFPSLKGTVGMEAGGGINGQLLVGARF